MGIGGGDGECAFQGVSGQFCSVVGCNHATLIERSKAQMDQVLHTSTDALCPAVFETAAKLAAVAPGDLRKSLFLSTGGEANDEESTRVLCSTGGGWLW